MPVTFYNKFINFEILFIFMLISLIYYLYNFRGIYNISLGILFIFISNTVLL